MKSGIENRFGIYQTFGATPPYHAFNPTESKSVSGAVSVTDWTWAPNTNIAETHSGNRTWLIANILNGDMATGIEQTTVVLWFDLPNDFGSWDKTSAITIDSAADITGWGNGNAGYEVKIYDTANSLDHTEFKVSWTTTGVFETDTLTGGSTGDINGTWTAGASFRVELSAKKDGTTSTGGGQQFQELRASRIRFNYNAL